MAAASRRCTSRLKTLSASTESRLGSNKVAGPGNKTGKPCQKAEKASFCVFSNECCARRKEA